MLKYILCIIKMTPSCFDANLITSDLHYERCKQKVESGNKQADFAYNITIYSLYIICHWTSCLNRNTEAELAKAYFSFFPLFATDVVLVCGCIFNSVDAAE